MEGGEKIATMMTPYPKYKPSGIEWIGEIPEQWNTKPLKYLLRAGKDGIKIGPFGSSLKTEFIKTEGYKVYGQENAINSDFNLGYRYIDQQKFAELSEYVLMPGDVIITMMGTTGKCKVVPDNIAQGIMDSHLIRVRTNENAFLSRLLALLINDSYFIYCQLKYNSKGSIMEGLNSSIIKSLNIFLPPIAEQNKILNFLDKKTSQIDLLISNKQKLIGLLKEEKTAIINEAVTKGINKKAKLKPSGIEWLGDVPEHWEVKKLKYVVQGRLEYGANESAELENTELPRYIRITDFGNDGKLKNDTFKSLPIEVAKDYLLSEGDILFARSGATVGKTFQFKDYAGVACFAGYLIRARPNEKILSDFLYAFTKSGLYENWKNSIFNQATIQNIGADKYCLLEIPLPPIDEQRIIIDLIEMTSPHLLDRQN